MSATSFALAKSASLFALSLYSSAFANFSKSATVLVTLPPAALIEENAYMSSAVANATPSIIMTNIN